MITQLRVLATRCLSFLAGTIAVQLSTDPSLATSIGRHSRPCSCAPWPAFLTICGLCIARSTCAGSEPSPDTIAAYTDNCATCHGSSLTGAFGPALKSREFHDKWASRSSSALVDFISQTMPPSNPGSLAPTLYVGLANYILLSNALPVADESAVPNGPATDTPIVDESRGLAADIANIDSSYRLTVSRRAHILSALTDVTESMLRNPPPQDWLQWRRTDDAFGFSPLAEVSKDDVHSLILGWSLALPIGTNEITPLVHDGVMFVNSNGTVLAIDAVSGDTLWKFVRPRTASPFVPPVTQSRSMAIFGHLLYVPTLDSHIIALDVQSGKAMWDHLISGSRALLGLTAGPIVVRGKVIQGMSGCAGAGLPGGCFIVALDAMTGDEIWRFNTLERPGGKTDSWNNAPLDQRFGGSVWSGGSYNVADNLVYFGTGQTYHIAPLMKPNPARRAANAALYTDTTLALNPDTGKLIWYYQHMARDVWDLDWSFERMLIPMAHDGESPNVVATVGKLGILDAIDAKSGKYVFSFDLGLQNLVIRIDPKTGWKTTDPALEPDPKQPKFICPFAAGVRNWGGTSYDPSSHLLFVPVVDSCMEFTWKYSEASDITYGPRPRKQGDGMNGGLYTINLADRKLQWSDRYRAPASSAVLATAGSIVFEGGRDRYFRATDSQTGKELWSARLDNVLSSSPVTYSVNGTQFVAVSTGGGAPNDVMRESLTPELEPTAHATTLWVFRLPPGSEH